MSEKRYKIETNNEIVNAIINTPPSHTDPNGSYTGIPKNKDEKPQQDADDL